MRVAAGAGVQALWKTYQQAGQLGKRSLHNHVFASNGACICEHDACGIVRFDGATCVKEERGRKVRHL